MLLSSFPRVQYKLIGLFFSITVFFYASVVSAAETLDFEDVEFEDGKSYQRFANHTFESENYELKVWEGLLIDDTYLLEEWSGVVGENESFHPNKSPDTPQNENKSLVTQRISIKSKDGSPFVLCEFLVASKHKDINVQTVRIFGEYFEGDALKVNQVSERGQNISGSNYHVVDLKGLYLWQFHWQQDFSRFELKVGESRHSLGQLHFDDIVLAPARGECN